MPGKNKPTSEYKKRFRWHDSHLATTLKPALELAGPSSAGIASATLGKVTKESLEPPLQQRRKPLGNDNKRTYTTSHFYNPAPSSSEDGNVPHSKSPGIKLRSPAHGHRERHHSSPGHKHQERHHHSSPGHRSGDALPKNDQNRRKTSGPKDDRHKTYSKLTNGHHPTERVQAVRMSNGHSSSGGSKSKGSHRSSNDSGKSSKKPHDVDAALQYQAGVRARPLGPRYMSEYQRQFAWKQASKESPLIAADELIHKSSTNIAPFDPSKIPKKTEYNTQFKAYYPPAPSHQQQLQENVEREMRAKYKVKTKTKKHKNNSLSPEVQLSQTAGKPSVIIHEDADRLRGSQNPQKPFFPHTPVRKWKSEYHSNFKSPSMFSYEDGVWKGAKPPHLNPQDSGTSETEKQGKLRHAKSEGDIPSWFAEVLELRNRAQEYQRRAQGTHFSRERLVQLWCKGANQATDDSSTSSSTTSSDVKEENRLSTSVRSPYGGSTEGNSSTDHVGDGQQQQNGRSTRGAAPPSSKTSPVRRRLAWDGGGTKRETGERRSSYGSIPTPEGYKGSVSASSDDFEVLSENGRLPTPSMEHQQTRHHLDKTTPAVGGAILTSPPRRIGGNIPTRPATAPAHKTSPPHVSVPTHRTSPQRRKSPTRRTAPPQRRAVTQGSSPPQRTNGYGQGVSRAITQNHQLNSHNDHQETTTRGTQLTKSMPGRVTSILPGGVSKAFEYDSDEEDEISSPLVSSDGEGTQDGTLTPRRTPPRNLPGTAPTTPPRVQSHNADRNLQSLQTSPTAGKSTKDPDPLNPEPTKPFQRHSNRFFESRPDVHPRVELSSKTWAEPRSLEHNQGPSGKTERPHRWEEKGKTYNLNKGPLNRPSSGNLHGRPQTAHPQTRERASMQSSSQRIPPEERPNSFIPSSRPDRAPPIRNDSKLANQREEELGSGDLSDISTMSTSSSISLASEVLDRAKKRRDDFWGKKVR